MIALYVKYIQNCTFGQIFDCIIRSKYLIAFIDPNICCITRPKYLIALLDRNIWLHYWAQIFDCIIRPNYLIALLGTTKLVCATAPVAEELLWRRHYLDSLTFFLFVSVSSSLSLFNPHSLCIFFLSLSIVHCSLTLSLFFNSTPCLSFAICVLVVQVWNGAAMSIYCSTVSFSNW